MVVSKCLHYPQGRRSRTALPADQYHIIVFFGCPLSVPPLLKPKDFGITTHHRRWVIPAGFGRLGLQLWRVAALRGQVVSDRHGAPDTLLVPLACSRLVIALPNARGGRNCYFQELEWKNGPSPLEFCGADTVARGMDARLCDAKGTSEPTSGGCPERTHHHCFVNNHHRSSRDLDPATRGYPSRGNDGS